MSEQETLRLVAEIVDHYSGPMRQMMQQLQKIGDASKDTHTKGKKDVDNHTKKYRELGEQIRKVKDHGVNVLTPSLAAMGVTIYGVSEGLGKLVDNLRGAGERWNSLNQAAKRSGASPAYVNAIGRAFERLGMDVGKADAAVSNIGESLDKLKAEDPQERNRLTAVYQDLLPFLDQILKGAKDRADQINRIAAAVTDENFPIWKREKLAEAFGIDPALAAKSGKDYAAALRDAIKRELEHPVDVDLLKRLQEAFAHLGQAQRDYHEDLIAIFGPPGVKLVEGFAEALDWVGKKYRENFGGHGNVPFNRESIFGRAAEALGFKTKAPQSANERVTGAFDALTKKEHEETVARGTARGVIEAFREWMSSKNEAQQFAEGLRPMAYHPDGGQGEVGAGGVGAAKRGGYFGSKEFPAVDASGGGAFSKEQRDANGGASPIDASGGAAYLANRRAPFRKELDADPETRKLLGAVISAENAGAGPAVAESLMNRTELVNESRAKRGLPPLTLKDMINGHPSIGGGKSFYGPMRSGAINEHLRKMNNAAFASKMNRYIDQALGGSNVIEGHTDQGSRGDPNYEKGGIGKNINGERFNDWGYPGSADFRRRLQAGYDASNRAKQRGAQLRDMIHRGGRRPPSDAELLKQGRRAVDAGALDGNAKLDITLNGFPRGTRTAHKVDGIFKEVALSRGRQMPSASEIS